MRISLLFIVVFSMCAGVFSQSEPLISSIEVQGNKMISLDKIVAQIKTRVNQPYNENMVSQDIKRIFSMGYFKDISVKTEKPSEGKITVIFVVKERPVLKDIIIKGAKRVSRAQVRKTIDLEKGNFLSFIELKEAKEALVDLYVKRGFSENAVDYDINVNDETNEAKVVFVIDEGKRLRIKKLNIEGNVSFTGKRILKLIKTRAAGWFFQSGFFKPDVLRDDLERIKDFYKKEGFTDVQVDYKKEIDSKKGLIYLTINIEEGRRYLIGKVGLEGVLKIPEAQVEKVMTLNRGDIYSEDKIRAERVRIQEVFFNKGYIFAQVKPISFIEPSTNLVDVTFQIEENNLTYVRMIDIRGNTKTKDKVIRRELKLKPMEPFDGEKLQRSRMNLQNLGFFEEVTFDTQPTTKPDYQDLVVDVKETKTGSFSFGGGYSSVDEFIGFVELRQKNFDIANWPYFTGAGQDLSIYLQAGSNTQEYLLSFTEPWIFDKPVSFGFDAYRRNHDRESDVGYGYNEERKGGKLRLGRRFSDFLRGGINYNFETITISDVSDDASSDLKNEKGENDISSLGLSLTYDKRDNPLSPSRGFVISNSFDLAGGFLAGDKDFMRFSSKGSVYFPVFRSSVLELRARAGIVKEYDDSDKVPIYERFFAGGASTIRGYRERKVGPIDSLNDDPLGGEALFVGNIEYTYPVGEYLKLATFFDSGNVWADSADFLNGGLKSSVGLGLRVKTPLGPVSIDYGYPLDKEPGEDKKAGRFHFNISRGF